MCYLPIRATLNPEGGRPTLDPEGELRLPCGSCDECLKKRASEWAIRAKHEISLHKENCFITLTYDEENLPSDFIIKDDFQKFIKRVRKFRKEKNLRYMVSYEYGTHTYRPHMHAIIFGYNPNKQKYLKTTKSGERIFTSPEIERLWGKGYHSIGTANEKTAYYIAAYALKGKAHDIMHPLTGEFTRVRDSFDCSKRPGIGLEYWKKHYKNLIAQGEIIPRYYIKKLEKEDNEMFEDYQNSRDIKNRSSQNLLSKYIIGKSAKSMNKMEFRENETERQDKQIIKILKENRDNYVTLTKGK